MFKVQRNAMQICEDAAKALNPAFRAAILDELVSNPNVRADIIRTRLQIHNVPLFAIEAFITEYEFKKSKV